MRGRLEKLKAISRRREGPIVPRPRCLTRTPEPKREWTLSDVALSPDQRAGVERAVSEWYAKQYVAALPRQGVHRFAVLPVKSRDALTPDEEASLVELAKGDLPIVVVCDDHEIEPRNGFWDETFPGDGQIYRDDEGKRRETVHHRGTETQRKGRWVMGLMEFMHDPERHDPKWDYRDAESIAQEYIEDLEIVVADLKKQRDAMKTERDRLVGALGLTFGQLRTANHQRANLWNSRDAGILFAVVEMAGEVGEACNIAKKMARHELGMVGGELDMDGLRREVADVVICADLVARSAGFDLGEAVAEKFNETSRKRGFRVFLPETERPTPH